MREAADNLTVQRRTIVIAIAATMPAALLVWLALRFLLPDIPGMEQPVSRLGFALGAVAIAVLLALLPGVEAVAHERLVTPAIDPLAGYETQRMRVNLRYLQNTLEQTMVFAGGLLPLAWYCADGSAMRAVVATTVVWILTRWAFWIGYHRSPLLRGLGAAGMLQSLLVLLYVAYRFGSAYGGMAGGLAPVVAFLGIEALLFAVTARPSTR